MNIIAHSLTPVLLSIDIRSLSGFGTRWRALVQSVLYLQYWTYKASPKTISERTSYRQVCLAFHPYPHLIPAFFNTRGFGPPLDFTQASAWTWIDHLASGLLHATYTAIFWLGFPSVPWLLSLNLATYNNSPAHYAKGTKSHLIRCSYGL